MLVRFLSSETGELLMFAETAGQLLRLLGKETLARGSFLQDEMLTAAAALHAAVERGEQQSGEAAADDEDEAEDGKGRREEVVTLRQRAWPLIDMLERTSRGGPKANIVWEAAGDF